MYSRAGVASGVPVQVIEQGYDYAFRRSAVFFAFPVRLRSAAFSGFLMAADPLAEAIHIIAVPACGVLFIKQLHQMYYLLNKMVVQNYTNLVQIYTKYFV